MPTPLDDQKKNVTPDNTPGLKKAFYADRKHKPKAVKLNPPGIPKELQRETRWVAWKFVWKGNTKGGGKWDKPPVSAATGKVADCTNPANQGTPSQAWRWLPGGKADGIGFVLGDGYIGIDVDDCRDPATGELSTLAQQLLSQFQSYAEVSPSGTGLKILGRGALPCGCRNANKSLGIEVYDSGRYFTVTGHILEGSPPEVCDLQAAIDAHLVEYLGSDPPPSADYRRSQPETVVIDTASQGDPPAAAAVVERLLGTWKHCERVRQLWRGDTAGYESRSEAEYSLLGSIAFFTGPHAKVIDAVYQSSELCDPGKWDRLAAKTITKILGGMTEFYDWSGGAKATFGGKTKPHTALPSASHATTAHEAEAGARHTPYVPFPVDVLPAPLRPFVLEMAAAIPCDPAAVALPALVVCAAAAGMARVLRIKASWSEPPIIWGAIVARSGSVKSPPVEHATGPLSRIDLELRKEHARAYRVYADAERQRKAAERARKAADAKLGRKPEGPDDIPAGKAQLAVLLDADGAPVLTRPPKRRSQVQDITLESLGLILSENPKGLLVYRDELSAWFNSLNRYSRTDTTSDWLTLFHGRMFTMDRKTGDHLTVAVPHAGVSIVGTIQPKVLARAFTEAFWDAGGAARMLLVMPPPQQKRWTEDDVSRATLDGYEQIIRMLRALEPAAGKSGPEPIEVRFTPEARRRWATFVDEWGLLTYEAGDEDGNLAATFAKLEAYVGRFALVFHLVSLAGQGSVPSDAAVGLETLEAAISLAKWFAHEARRVYAALAEDDQSRRLREVADRIARGSGRTTARDLQRSNSRKYPTAAAAETVLKELVIAGWGRWEETQPESGGHPVREFVLFADNRLAESSTVIDKPAEQSSDT
jgi:hypothetical protein